MGPLSQAHLYVCQTCVRDLAPPPGEPTRGRLLADAIATILDAAPPEAWRPTLRRVACLNACLSPCSVALRAPGKLALRFSRLGPEAAADVVALAAAYGRSNDGDLPEDALPPALKNKLSARAPGSQPRPH